MSADSGKVRKNAILIEPLCCPFCGKMPFGPHTIMARRQNSTGIYFIEKWAIVCSFSKCLVRPEVWRTDKRAVLEAWNRRAHVA